MAKAEYDFDSYLAEAHPTSFMLRVSLDRVIEIKYPDSERMLKVDEATSARQTLTHLCGDQWNEVFKLVKDKHGKVLEKLASDIRDHFGLSGNQPGAGQAS